MILLKKGNADKFMQFTFDDSNNTAAAFIKQALAYEIGGNVCQRCHGQPCFLRNYIARCIRIPSYKIKHFKPVEVKVEFGNINLFDYLHKIIYVIK